MEMHRPPPPPGWFPNPDGPGQRYWDGTSWTEHVSGRPPAPPQPGSGGPGWKIGLAVLLVVIVAISGCFFVLESAVEEGVEEVGKGLNRYAQRHAITFRQYRSIESGSSRAGVIEKLGVEPGLAERFEDEGLPSDRVKPSCIYYAEKGKELGEGRIFEFCFEDGRLKDKNAY
jgi:hypothetical protein